MKAYENTARNCLPAGLILQRIFGGDVVPVNQNPGQVVQEFGSDSNSDMSIKI